MRATDDRYAGERGHFDLAVRMIRHEARTGTIRQCTGFTEDRIRKIYVSYFVAGQQPLRRRRGKTPTQIAPFVSSIRRQGEASLLGCLLVRTGAASLDPAGRSLRAPAAAMFTIGCRFCDAYEGYLSLHPAPQLSFEWGWNLYQSLVAKRELRLEWCALCLGAYVEDAYSLNYHRCPFCALKDQAARGPAT